MPLYGYAGREPDPSSGLVYMRARYYDAALGRFISRDPIGLSGGLNVYAYVGNNPVNYVDPDGLFAKSVSNTLQGWGNTASQYYDRASSALSNFGSQLDASGTVDQFGRKLAYDFVQNNPSRAGDLSAQG